MRKLILLVVLSFFVPVFAEGYTKDTWYCEIARSCELSDYTGKYTKNCEDFSKVSVYWEYVNDKHGNSLFCHRYGKKEKQCTKIISNDTDENDDGEEILMVAVGGIKKKNEYGNYYWETAGKKLKAKSGWNNNGNGTDEFGFSALPDGFGSLDGSFYDVGDGGYWWSASENGSNNANYRYMSYDNDYAYWFNDNKDYLFSVRCLQD